MINITLILKVGRLDKNGVFTSTDEYDLEDYENVSEILEANADSTSNHATLNIHVTGWVNDRDLVSFKRIKIKRKNKFEFKWVVVE